MAAAQAIAKRVRIATLAVAGLIAVGSWLGWRSAQGPALSTAVVTQPPQQPVSAPLADAAGPVSTAAPIAHAEPLPTPAVTAETVPVAEPADARERERLAFVRRMNTADAQRTLGAGIPLAVSRLVGSGRLREAVNELLQMGRDGDANGYAALEQLLGSCPGPGNDRDSERRALDLKARNQQMIDRMASAGASDALLDQLRWSLDAGNSFYRGIWAEFCPSREAGDYRALLDEVRGVLPARTPSKYAEQLRTAADAGTRPASGVGQAYEREWEAHLRRRAEAGVIEAQVQLARKELLGADAAQKTAAFTLLRSLAPLSLEALDALAMCARFRCTPEVRDPDRARELVLETARAGSVDALGQLESGIRPIIEDSAERYAWSQVRHELHAQGCVGFGRFSMWAFRHARRREDALLQMTPREADVAKRRAEEMIETEVPAIRARLGCD